jgi:lysozyme
MNLSLSQKGIDFIKSFEKYRAEVYEDQGGLKTIGYGHLVKQGENWAAGIDHIRALQVLRLDVGDATRCVNTVVRVNIDQPQFDALASLTFNIGCENFRESTLLKLLNKVDVTGASEQFLVWDKVKGEVSAGLTARREAERRIFDTGEYVNHI